MKKTMLLIFFLSAINFMYSQADKADRIIKDLMQKNKITGLQLAVVKDNKIIKTGHYGMANIEDSIAVDSETVFSINSMTKSFTSLAIIQLAEKGKLKLEDPISKHLDSLPITWQNLTIKQIATHTSGVPEIWDSEGNLLSENSEILFKKIKELPFVFKQGEEYRNAHGNYMLLGMLIEKISGQSYEKYIAENIFKKAQMKNSIKAGIGDFYNIIKHSAKPYSYYGSNILRNVYQPMPSNLYPAGGIYSTATEMAQWIIALQTHKLINEENLKTLLKPIELNNGKIFEITDFFNRRSIGFAVSSRTETPVLASLGGNRNALYIYPKDNVSVVILTNLIGSRPESFIEEIANLYISKKE